MPGEPRIESDGGPDRELFLSLDQWYLGGIYPAGSPSGSVTGGEKIFEKFGTVNVFFAPK